MTEYLQKKLDNRKHRGFDKLVTSTLPSFLDDNNYDGVPEYMAKKIREKKRIREGKKKL